MFACALLLVLLLPVALLPPVLEDLFSASELTEMGIRLGDPRAGDPVQIVDLLQKSKTLPQSH